tara:strand:- start:659 stop:772 length:114 start_codon:yes stop_codon:yes gene_type:complete
MPIPRTTPKGIEPRVSISLGIAAAIPPSINPPVVGLL